MRVEYPKSKMLRNFQDILISSTTSSQEKISPNNLSPVKRLHHHTIHAILIMSFRFLNPRMVDEDPEFLDDVCYKGIGDEPEILCRDIPPNQLRFLGWW